MGSNAALRCFVSYSHEDERWLKLLQQHLQPLVQEGTLAVWDDTKIAMGAIWRTEIETALAATRFAVLLVSKSFLASDFIVNDELPVLLARAAQKGVRVIPVLVGSCLFKRSRLSQFQPANTPESPLDCLSPSEADKVLVKVAQAIADEASKAQEAAPSSSRHKPKGESTQRFQGTQGPRRSTTHASSDRGELTVHLRLHQGSLHRTIHTEFQASDLPALPLAQVKHDGNALFELLFGADVGRWSEALKPLFPEQRVIPSRHPVRVRIWTEVAELLGLPWGLTAYKGSPLREHGWTFELTDRQVAEGERRLRLPTGVLVILPGLAPGAADTLGSEVHRQALQEVFESYYPESTRDRKQFAVAHTREEVVSALHAVKPAIVYYYGLGQGGDNPGLCLPARSSSAPHVWSAHDLQHAIVQSQAPVEVIYLNGRTDTPGGLAGLGLRLLSVAPAVVTPASDVLPSDTSSDGETANRWFRRLLGDEAEPAIAPFLREPLSEPQEPEADPSRPTFWLPVSVLTRYRSFQVERRRPLEWRPRRGSDFDRHRQRKVAFAELRELVQSPTRKVQGFLTFGPTDNHQDEVASQLHHYAEDLDENMEMLLGKPVSLGRLFQRNIEHVDEHLLSRWAGELNVFLNQPWSTPLSTTLTALAPPPSRNRRRVLWLDWGVAVGLPVSDDVGAWLRFVAARILPAVPSAIHVVVSLAIEAPENFAKDLEDALEEVVTNPDFRTDQMRCSVLHPLGPANRGEILEFLDVTQCPTNLRVELADLLLKVTKGEYRPMRQWIDRALNASWVDVAEPLRLAAGKKPAAKKLV